ncbi:hypothetical protein CEV32_3175 [Brucella rhizosphaerae]|uniref:Uncharacterized protein n=1 Tax=Brucella rhizosphaerae TaxID=571254 RepID=A0A256FUG9_9HYPH|nr:hypothetical protein CEV32_3175 [Brucella rhizosphaerae]
MRVQTNNQIEIRSNGPVTRQGTSYIEFQAFQYNELRLVFRRTVHDAAG